MAAWGLYGHGVGKEVHRDRRWIKQMERLGELESIKYLHSESEKRRLAKVETCKRRLVVL